MLNASTACPSVPCILVRNPCVPKPLEARLSCSRKASLINLSYDPQLPQLFPAAKQIPTANSSGTALLGQRPDCRLVLIDAVDIGIKESTARLPC